MSGFSIIQNPSRGGGTPAAEVPEFFSNPATGVVIASEIIAGGVRRDIFTLTSVAVDVLNAGDSGSLAIADILDGSMYYCAGGMNLDVVGGGGVSVITTLVTALGLVANTSATMATVGSQSFLASATANGSGDVLTGRNSSGLLTASIVSQGMSVNFFSSRQLFLNCAYNGLASDGTATYDGTITLYYLGVAT